MMILFLKIFHGILLQMMVMMIYDYDDDDDDEVTPIGRKAVFSSKKVEKTCFRKKYVRSPHEKSRNVTKLGCFDDWQSQKKSVISWFLDSGKLISLGKRKVVYCCSFLLW